MACPLQVGDIVYIVAWSNRGPPIQIFRLRILDLARPHSVRYLPTRHLAEMYSEEFIRSLDEAEELLREEVEHYKGITGAASLPDSSS